MECMSITAISEEGRVAFRSVFRGCLGHSLSFLLLFRRGG
jgi:hypothetical protein